MRRGQTRRPRYSAHPRGIRRQKRRRYRDGPPQADAAQIARVGGRPRRAARLGRRDRNRPRGDAPRGVSGGVGRRQRYRRQDADAPRAARAARGHCGLQRETVVHGAPGSEGVGQAGLAARGGPGPTGAALPRRGPRDELKQDGGAHECCTRRLGLGRRRGPRLAAAPPPAPQGRIANLAGRAPRLPSFRKGCLRKGGRRRLAPAPPLCAARHRGRAVRHSPKRAPPRFRRPDAARISGRRFKTQSGPAPRPRHHASPKAAARARGRGRRRLRGPSPRRAARPRRRRRAQSPQRRGEDGSRGAAQQYELRHLPRSVPAHGRGPEARGMAAQVFLRRRRRL
mmetsp:Transcript_27284/g.91704  ORF Transcript_27284/g.91704 Transcript_27284/m.91704 type:complete len:340 (-) Transcript_27284:532-1551(-)